MKLRFCLSLSLLTVLMASACASAGTESPTQPLVDVPSPTLEVAVQPPVELTPNLPADTLPIATSRGPDLEATDPTTISLASGQIQFIEFFRFT